MRGAAGELIYLGREPSCRRCFHHWAKDCPTGNPKAKADWPPLKIRRCLPEAGRSLCCLPVCKRVRTKKKKKKMMDVEMLLGRQRNLWANASSSGRIKCKLNHSPCPRNDVPLYCRTNVNRTTRKTR